MNMELIGKALEVCPVTTKIGSDVLALEVSRWENGDFVYRHTSGWTIEEHDFNAINAMTAQWLAWLIERKSEPLFPTRPASPCGCCVSVWVDEQTPVDCHGDTLVEVLASAVVDVHGSNQQESPQ